MNPVAKSRPSLIPAAAVKEPGVETAEAAGGHQHLGCRNMGGVKRIDTLSRGKRKRAIRVENRFNGFSLGIHAMDFIDEESFFAIEEAFKKSRHFSCVVWSRNDSGQLALSVCLEGLKKHWVEVLLWARPVFARFFCCSDSGSDLRSQWLGLGEEKQSDPRYFVNNLRKKDGPAPLLSAVRGLEDLNPKARHGVWVERGGLRAGRSDALRGVSEA